MQWGQVLVACPRFLPDRRGACRPHHRMANDRFVETPPAGADGWREVWKEDRSYRPRASPLGFFLGFIRGIFRRAVRADADRQRDFNLTLLDLLQDVRRELE